MLLAFCSLGSATRNIIFGKLLRDHLCDQLQDRAVPSGPTIYRHRLVLDAAGMVFASHCYLSPALQWAVHLRADASPQDNKDYFVVEADWMDTSAISDETRLPDVKERVKRRLLPLQLIGDRAATVEQKCFRLRLALAGDTASVDLAFLRTFSLAFDMGTESKLFQAPEVREPPVIIPVQAASPLHARLDPPPQPLDLVLPTQLPPSEGDGQDQDLAKVSRLCPRALPIKDANHGLPTTAFTGWGKFHGTLRVMSKYFGHWGRLRCIERNELLGTDRICQSFSAMFTSACPSLVERRWEYLLPVYVCAS